MSMDLVESLDNVHGYSRQSPESPLRLAAFPWTHWVLSTISLENVHGLPGLYPWTLSVESVNIMSIDILDNVQADYTMSSESMGSIDIVHRQSPLFVLNEFVKKTQLELE